MRLLFAGDTIAQLLRTVAPGTPTYGRVAAARVLGLAGAADGSARLRILKLGATEVLTRQLLDPNLTAHQVRPEST